MTGRTQPLAHVPGLHRLASAQLGVVRRDQLRGLGVTRHHIRNQVSAQRWQTVGPTVVAVMTGALTRDQSLWAATLNAGPGSALHGLTALELHGLDGWDCDDVHVQVPHGRRPPPLGGVVVHQTRRAAELELTVRQGLPCQAVPWATLDAAARMSRRSAAGLVVAVIQRRLTGATDVLDALERSSRHRHRALLRSCATEAAGGADSLAEIEAARLVVLAGLPQPRRQVVVMTADGPRRVDLIVTLPDGSLLVIEVDGVHHADPRRGLADAAKDAALIAAGCSVLRLSVATIRSDPDGVVRQLQAIRAGRTGV